MEKKEEKFSYPNQDGKATTYQVETYKKEGQEPITVVRNSPENQGQKFGKDWNDREVITEQLAKEHIKDFKIDDVKKVEMYQERPDGDFDKVKFQNKANDKGELVWEAGDREKFTKEQVNQRISDYENGQNKDNKTTLPNLDRGKLLDNKNEIKGYEEQVKQHRVDDKTEQQSSKQTQQDEVSRNQERQRNQEITR